MRSPVFGCLAMLLLLLSAPDASAGWASKIKRARQTTRTFRALVRHNPVVRDYYRQKIRQGGFGDSYRSLKRLSITHGVAGLSSAVLFVLAPTPLTGAAAVGNLSLSAGARIDARNMRYDIRKDTVRHALRQGVNVPDNLRRAFFFSAAP